MAVWHKRLYRIHMKICKDECVVLIAYTHASLIFAFIVLFSCDLPHFRNLLAACSTWFYLGIVQKVWYMYSSFNIILYIHIWIWTRRWADIEISLCWHVVKRLVFRYTWSIYVLFSCRLCLFLMTNSRYVRAGNVTVEVRL